MRFRSSFVTAALCASLGCAASLPALAQEAAPSAPPATRSYTDAELKSFAVAALEVQRINDAYLPKFKAATTPEEQTRVEKNAVAEMIKAVEKEGMTVDKYKEIMSQAETNPDVAERVIQHIRGAQK